MDDIFSKIGTTQTLSQKIERKVEEAIRQKKLLSGAKLPSEKELCGLFGVSRTALREALRRLSARGLIEIRKGSGMYVSEIKIEDAIKSLNLYYDLSFDSDLISQIIDVRRIFEPEISRLAARNRTDDDIKILEQVIEELETCDPDNTQQEVDTINRFHMSLAKATGNPIIIISLEPIYSLLPRMRNFIYANVEGEKEFTIEAQKKILEAVKANDEDAAFKETEKLVIRNHEVYDRYLKKVFK
ncbi:FadR/GntR family transcriptional regulator [Marinilabilia sp.]|uniref:FadR/GntR family transcriptional regulator n=1 Tax=Marinilabilia sp. TaxID=2021252 RepID=UPI0025C52652|nr:FadR/GntR family transcriptional regulator [Marinilabilia sp.]